MLRPRPRAVLVTMLALASVVGLVGCAEVAGEGDFAVVEVPTPTTEGPPASLYPPPLEWRECGEHVECADMPAPLDYGQPDGPSITVRVARRVARDPERRLGVLAFNPGGPGVPGAALVALADRIFSSELLDRFDIVSWDPRGTGASAGVDCVDDLDPLMSLDPTPDDATERAALVDAAKAFDEACEAAAGDLLPHVSTADSARDLDRIRHALGEAEVTYVGFSYGSELGGTYATAFPTHVRAMVLDGALDPSTSGIEIAAQQAEGNELALDRFLAWCDGERDCGFGAGRAEGAFDRLMADLDAHPLAAPSGRPTIGQGVAYVAVIQALYQRTSWPDLGDALGQAADGDGRGLLALYDAYLQRRDDGSYTNVIEAFNAISCLDNDVPRDPAAYDAVATQFAAVAPRLGAVFAYNFVCALWPVPAVVKAPVTATGAGPVLVVAATGDAATPYRSSEALVAALDDGHLLTRDGDGHTSYEPGGCIAGHVDRYLIDLQVPPEGTTCEE